MADEEHHPPRSEQNQERADRASIAWRSLAALVAVVALISVPVAFAGTTGARTPRTTRGPFVFNAGGTRYIIKTNGNVTDATTTSGASLLRPGPLLALKKGGRWFPVTSLEPQGSNYRATFGRSGVSADLSINSVPDALVIRLLKLRGSGVQQFDLVRLSTKSLDTEGSWLVVRSNAQRALTLLGLEDSVHAMLIPHSQDMRASVYPEFGMEGRGAAIVSAPKSSLLEEVHKVELRFGLPSPTIGGKWAKTLPDANSSYLFTDLTEANVDDTIRYAKLGNFKYILIYAWTWSRTLGSYPINRKSYPHGEAGLRATIAKVHAAGLKVGMHMLSSWVSKGDALTHPKPDPRLFKDARAQLAVEIGGDATQVVATNALRGFPTSRALYAPTTKTGIDIQIDDEILECPGVGKVDPRTFSGCRRGFAGTHPAAHKAGATIYHLAERYNSYLVDLRSSLKDELAARIAGLVDRCKFDMVFFDGGLANTAQGPAWYWVHQQQLAIWKRTHRSLLMLGSGQTQWDWHMFARMSADDPATLAPKAYLDSFKIARRWHMYQDNFIAADLGWWGMFDATPERPATLPDETELYGTRMLALDAPISMETTAKEMRDNGRSLEMLRTLGQYERLRLDRAIPLALREKLRSGEWHMVFDGRHLGFAPTEYSSIDVSAPGHVRVENPNKDQPFRFRVTPLPNAVQTGAMSLLGKSSALHVPLPKARARMPGALVYRIPLGANVAAATSRGSHAGVNLESRRALAVTLRVTGPPAQAGSLPGVLNIQLESTSNRFRDYLVDLDFRGTRSVIMARPQPGRMLRQFRALAYNFKAALKPFSYDHVASVNIRWMRLPPHPLKVEVVALSAPSESSRNLHGLMFFKGASAVNLPAILHPGDYAEYVGAGTVRVFDRHGNLLASSQVAKPIQLGAGPNDLGIRIASPGRFRLTTITEGAVENVDIAPTEIRALSRIANTP